MRRAPLFDGHGRRISDLRVSVTDRCNFRCQYCMPAEGLPWLQRDEVLRFEEIERLVRLLADLYDEPKRTVVVSEALHAIIGHRRRGDPITVEAGVVRVADALDLAKGRSRVPFETRRPNIHLLSAAAIDEVTIEPGEDRAVSIEIAMNNSAGIFQVDELLATKLRGSGLEEHVEFIARIEAEHEKRLLKVYQI